MVKPGVPRPVVIPIAGIAWFLLSAVSLALLGQELLATVQRAGSSAPSYDRRPRTAGRLGLAWWVMRTLQSAKWAGLGLIPGAVVVTPLVTTLIATVAASMLGAWLYEGVDGSPRFATHARQR